MIGKMETEFFGECVAKQCHPLTSGRLTSNTTA
jgi:hypothetical protein